MIRFIEEPKVYVIASPSINIDMLKFLHDEGVPAWATDAGSAAETLCEFAGRTCYMSFAKPRPGGNKAYLGHILEVGHGSVLEHANWSIVFTGVSRSCTHELIRHRAGFAYSQLSQRYVDESDCAFVVPPALLPHYHASQVITKAMNDNRGDYDDLPEWPMSETFDEWAWACQNAVARYLSVVSDIKADDTTAARKKAREAARSLLPNATETKIVVTGNARAWRHFLEMRGSEHADAEIRRLAIAVLGKLQPESPNIFGDYRIETIDGVDAITTPNRKV